MQVCTPSQTTTPTSHHSVFYRPDALPATQPTASKHWRQVPSDYTHTTVSRPHWILSGTTRVSWHQKGKTNLDLLEQEIVIGSGINCAICKFAPWPRHITSQHPTTQFFQGDHFSGKHGNVRECQWKNLVRENCYSVCMVWVADTDCDMIDANTITVYHGSLASKKCW